MYFLFQTAQQIFGGDIKVHLLLFGSPKDDNYETLRGEFQTAAKDFRGKVKQKKKFDLKIKMIFFIYYLDTFCYCRF